jgi:hypothetical protein
MSRAKTSPWQANNRVQDSSSTSICTRSAAKCVTPYLIGTPVPSISRFSIRGTGCRRVICNSLANSELGSTLQMRLHLGV